jgi:hypothetical protein
MLAGTKADLVCPELGGTVRGLLALHIPGAPEADVDVTVAGRDGGSSKVLKALSAPSLGV